MHLFFSILLIVVGIVFLYSAIKQYTFVRRILNDGEKTTATIVNVREEEDYDPEHGRSVSYYPTYEYTDRFGLACKYTATETTSLEKYHIGDKVPIVYTPGEKSSVVILSRFGKFGSTYAMTLIGLMCFSFGCYQFSTTWFLEKLLDKIN